jgi:hypothetical protein
MVLREARVKFSYLWSEKLCPKARELGFEYALDEVTNHQDRGHMVGSLHYSGCAGDLLLYKDKSYQIRTEDYRELGEYWESLDPDCKWGGRWGDGNHFSLAPLEIFGGKK